MNLKTANNRTVLMLLVLLLGLILRFHGLVWTLPYFFHGDETRLVYNGITIQQFGVQDYVTNVTNMSNYPPYRSWEIAITRSVLLALFGEDEALISLEVLFGRMFSLFYALLTIALLYQLGKRVTGNATIGMAAAMLFAVWSETILFGQRALSDGAGLMFFTLCALLSVIAYQKLSYQYLVGAVLAGIFAGLGKYNYFPALIFPVFAGLYFLVKRPRQMLLWVVLPSVILAIPVLVLALKTVSQDDLFYNYLNETAQLESALRDAILHGADPNGQEVRELYYRYPLNVLTRFGLNYNTFLEFLPPYVFALALLGMVSLLLVRGAGYDYRSLFVLGFSSLVTVLAFSRFRIVEGRQMFSAMLPLLIFCAIGIAALARYSKAAAVVLFAVLVIPSGLESWAQNIEYAKPDTRVATVNWFLENVRDGTGIAIESEPYEFWEQNGYHADKRFNVVRSYRLFEKEPQVWENEGFYYLVADEGYAWRGGYYAGHPLQEYWDPLVEIVARFEGDAYSGSDRIIMRSFRPQVKVDAMFGDVVTFYGYDAEYQALQGGETLAVKYYWEARNPNGIDYIVFNHLISAETGEPLVLVDRLAGHNGAHPSSQWEAHEWLFDQFDLVIPEDAPPGEYILQIGLYNAQDGVRLPVEGGENGILELFEITVEND